MIISTGIDIVETGRVRALLEAGTEFAERWFSVEEIRYCSSRARPWLHYAARLAAKEAVVKALRLAWDRPIRLKEISISSGDKGAPLISLNGSAKEAALRAGINTFHVSLSHTDQYAVASVIAVG
jgi:holo-[acyl-carrier protein] synthase